jgi:hypothetical protein
MASTFCPSARGETPCLRLDTAEWQSFAASSADNQTLGGCEDNGAIDPTYSLAATREYFFGIEAMTRRRGEITRASFSETGRTRLCYRRKGVGPQER